MSSISIAVAAHTTTRVQRLGVMKRVSLLEVVGGPSRLAGGRSREVPAPARDGEPPKRRRANANRRVRRPRGSVRQQPRVRGAHDERGGPHGEGARHHPPPPPVLPPEGRQGTAPGGA